MQDAQKNKYAAGYFESWNLDTLLAVCDAAEKMKSPVIIGFGGLFLTNKKRIVKDKLNIFANLARDACRSISVPACTLFNESTDFNSVLDSIDHGYDVVMFIGPGLTVDKLAEKVSVIVEKAHKKSVAVEAEIDELPGLDSLTGAKKNSSLTDPDIARKFVTGTSIDALSINIGQSHAFGKEVRLDFERLKEIKKATNIPLVLHGGSNLNPREVAMAIDCGISKFNLGRILKQTYLDTLRSSINGIGNDYNLYKVVGSGFREDVLVRARLAVQGIVEKYMKLYGSAGKA